MVSVTNGTKHVRGKGEQKQRTWRGRGHSLFQRLKRTAPTRRFRAQEYVARRALELNMMFVAVDLIRRRSQSMFSTLCHVFEISDDQWCMTTSLNSLRTGQPRSLPDPVFPLFRSHAISAHRSVFTDAVVEQFVWRELVLNAV